METSSDFSLRQPHAQNNASSERENLVLRGMLLSPAVTFAARLTFSNTLCCFAVLGSFFCFVFFPSDFGAKKKGSLRPPGVPLRGGPPLLFLGSGKSTNEMSCNSAVWYSAVCTAVRSCTVRYVQPCGLVQCGIVYLVYSSAVGCDTMLVWYSVALCDARGALRYLSLIHI